jgi:D-hexose-6-phosphate mutarotase
METNLVPEKLRRLEIPGRVKIDAGNGGLTRVIATSNVSTAEVYLNGAHVTGFQKNGEPPLLFVSRQSHYAPGQAIRGGVPICFPWFGPRADEPGHGFVRFTEWALVKTNAATDGTVTLTFALPQIPGREAWHNLRTEFSVTVAATLTMELVAANDSCDETLAIENCLHSYFYVGDIGAVSLTGLQGAPFDDFAFGANGARRPGSDSPLHITQETNRVYPDNAGTVEIRDEKLRRVIRVEKSHSQSTVVWNPWTTQQLPDDFDPAEHQQMVCVESGNVKQNKIFLAPGKMAALKVVLSSHPH